MGEPIVLEYGRIAYGQAQAQVMRAEKRPTERLPISPGIPAAHDAFAAAVPAQEAQAAETPDWTATDWTAIKGVSTEIWAALNYIGLYTPQSLLSFVTMGGDLTAIPDIGKKRAADIVEWAEDQL